MKRLFLLIIILSFLSCKDIKIPKNFKIDFGKYFKFKKKAVRKINIGINKSYLKTAEGRISREIVKDFMKYSGIKSSSIKKLENDKLIKDYKSGKLDVMISDPGKIPFKNQLSSPFLSDGIYFLTQTDNKKKINVNNLTGNIKTAFLNNSYASGYMEKKYGKRNNHLKYIYLDNMLNDFEHYKMDLIIINRDNYYENIFSLPSRTLSFFNFNGYSSVMMKDSGIREKFNGYIAKYNRNFDWSEKIFIKKTYVRYLENIIKDMDKFTAGK